MKTLDFYYFSLCENDNDNNGDNNNDSDNDSNNPVGEHIFHVSDPSLIPVLAISCGLILLLVVALL